MQQQLMPEGVWWQGPAFAQEALPYDVTLMRGTPPPDPSGPCSCTSEVSALERTPSGRRAVPCVSVGCGQNPDRGRDVASV